MTARSFRDRLFIIILLFSPLWAPYLQHIGNHNFFLHIDSLVLLALILLTGVIFEAFSPDGLLKVVDQCKAHNTNGSANSSG